MVAMLFRKVMLSAFTASVVLIGGASASEAGDVCKRVHFQVKNERPTRIRIYKVEYYNVADNKTRTEDVKNVECGPTATCITNGDNLPDAEGIKLRNFVFFFNYDANGNWSGNLKSAPKQPADELCHADKTYNGNTPWTISD